MESHLSQGFERISFIYYSKPLATELTFGPGPSSFFKADLGGPATKEVQPLPLRGKIANFACI